MSWILLLGLALIAAPVASLTPGVPNLAPTAAPGPVAGAVGADANAGSWSVDPVVISVSHVGPPLWRISSGTDEVWVLGVIGGVRSQDWDSRRLERVLATSSDVVTQPVGRVDMLGIAAMQFGGKLDSPRGAVLADLLGPGVWARTAPVWSAAGLSPEAYRRRRPGIAAILGQFDHDEANHLQDPEDRIRRLAAQRHVPVRPVAVYPANVVVRATAALPQDKAVACYLAETEALEFQTAHHAALEAAWRTSDVAGLRAHELRRDVWDCLSDADPVIGSFMTRTVDDSVQRIRDALAQHRHALFVLGVGSLVLSNGVLGRLAAAGYRVDSPD